MLSLKYYVMDASIDIVFGVIGRETRYPFVYRSLLLLNKTINASLKCVRDTKRKQFLTKAVSTSVNGYYWCEYSYLPNGEFDGIRKVWVCERLVTEVMYLNGKVVSAWYGD